MAEPPSLSRTAEAQAALDRIEDPGTRTFADMMLALVIRRAFGEGPIATAMDIDAFFLVKVFEEYFSDRDAVYKALSIGQGDARGG